MSGLSVALDDYLRLRRSLGYKLHRASQVLADFVAYSDAAGADHIRTDLAVSWALRIPNPDLPWRAGRLGVVRSFARYVQALDPVHEIPPVGLIPRGRGRPVPRLFTKEQVAALMSAARQLRTPPQAATVETVVGLLWATGLRVGEAIRLDDTDLDADNALLRVRGSKNGRSRTIPIDCTTADALCSYVDARNRMFGNPDGNNSLFVSTVGRRLRSGNLGTAFASVVDLAGLSTQGENEGFRLGGLRHSFAVQSLLEWHLAGLDVGALLPWLSTYMGHVSPASTYWYLSASPDLLRARPDGSRGGTAMTPLAPTMQSFFTVRLSAQRNASPNTVAAYRARFRLLVGSVQEAKGVSPAKLMLEDLDAPTIGQFLDHLESSRGASIKTRNSRLAAIHSLYRFAAMQHPEHASLIQRVLAIPAKRAPRALIFLPDHRGNRRVAGRS